MDYFADLHQLIRRDNVPFWNRPHQPRTAGRLRVVPLFSLALRRRGDEWNGTLRGGKRTSIGWERTLRRKKTGLGEDETRTRNRTKQGLGTGQNKNFEEEETLALSRRKKGIGNHVIL